MMATGTQAALPPENAETKSKTRVNPRGEDWSGV